MTGAGLFYLSMQATYAAVKLVRKCAATIPSLGLTLGAFLLYVYGFALAEELPAERRGLRFVRLHCAQCHAIDNLGASPLTNAPPFRTLHLKYAIADLQRPLAEGIHPTMPLFRLTTAEIEDVMEYLKSLR
jgi:cytochrome c